MKRKHKGLTDLSFRYPESDTLGEYSRKANNETVV